MSRFKRQIFYLGGFDPRGVRFYRQLMRAQLARYAERTGEVVSMTPRRGAKPHRSDWTIANGTAQVTTEYAFLRWEDIVRGAWIRNPLALAWRAARTYLAHLAYLDRAIARRLPCGPLITLAYPPLAALLLPLLIVALVTTLATLWLPLLAALVIAFLTAIAAGPPLLRAIHVPWLLRFFIFNSEFAGGEGHPELERRLGLFADAIVAGISSGHDEVLLVTHSNGSILAMSLMDQLLARFDGKIPSEFALVTFGQCIPLVAGRRDATAFHAELRRVAAGQFRWFDLGSPPDGAAFHGVNPLLFHAERIVPQVELLSPRFHIFYDAATYHRGWRNKYEIHFDYLRVGDRVSPLDLPSLTAARRTIAEAVALFRTIP